MTTANEVKALRERTGAGFMECKKALQESNNDLEKAIEYLRKKGLAQALKRQGRIAKEGRVHAYIHGQGKIGVLLEVNCETDFVANTDEFKTFVSDLAMQIAATNPRYLSPDLICKEELEKERAIHKAQAEAAGKTGPVVEKMVEGRIRKYCDEISLLRQVFVKDPQKTIEDLLKELIAKMGENITVQRFARFQLGEASSN